MPLLARPFLMPSRTAPADALLRNNIPGKTTPLTLATPPPLLPKKKEEGPEEGVRTPLRANSDPSLFSQPSRTARLMMITRIARYSQR